MGTTDTLAAPPVVDWRIPGWIPDPSMVPATRNEATGLFEPDYVLSSTAIVMAPGRTVLYHTDSEGNTVGWDAMEDARESAGHLETVLVGDTGMLLVDAARDHTKWGGHVNAYSLEPAAIVAEALRRGLVGPGVQVGIGNTSSFRVSAHLGTATQVVSRPSVPDRLVLWHGTADARLEDIAEHGLRAVDPELRMWKGDVDRGHPEYRDEAVYLAADPWMASTYAKRAVNILRRRGGRGVKGALLEIVLDAEDFNLLRPDDDFLLKLGKKHGDAGASWLDSLSYMAQVAFLGDIPPERIRVVADGLDPLNRAWDMAATHPDLRDDLPPPGEPYPEGERVCDRVGGSRLATR
jgi:hypothetical protein